ncbi:MAG: hypothetical protein ACREN4_09945 [Candidatus Dormibacteria bacterium]
MSPYRLYLESGPKRRKTMVHVPDLLGCVAVGPTTEGALQATPAAIQAFRRFLRRHGEGELAADGEGVEIVEHVTEGAWLGNGSPYLNFTPDLEPLDSPELERLLGRFRALHGELGAWAGSQSGERLDAPPAGGGRSGRGVLMHALGAAGPYLAAALGAAPGFSRTCAQAERGELELEAAFTLVGRLATERALGTSAAERHQVRERGGTKRTLRKAVRRMLEHDWEHLAELARRQGGPPL